MCRYILYIDYIHCLYMFINCFHSLYIFIYWCIYCLYIYNTWRHTFTHTNMYSLAKECKFTGLGIYICWLWDIFAIIFFPNPHQLFTGLGVSHAEITLSLIQMSMIQIYTFKFFYLLWFMTPDFGQKLNVFPDIINEINNISYTK